MKTLLFCLLFGLSAAAFCQLEEKIKKEGVVEGAILIEGKEVPGYIRKTGTTVGLAPEDKTVYPAPWQFQSSIQFILKEVFENTEKIRNKLYRRYDAKDCEGYRYDTMLFESVKYSDMSAVGMNMIPKKMFMRKISSDKISLFFYFDSPPAILSGNYERVYEECAEPALVYRVRKDGKLKRVNDLNIEKELQDCPMVAEKQSKGEYKALDTQGKKIPLGKFLGSKLINNTTFRTDVRLLAIDDYNKNCN